MKQYAIDLNFIQWDPNELIADLERYPNSTWASENGYANRYIRPKESNSLFEKIWQQIPELEINLGRTFYAELNPGQLLPPHIDYGRTASINFPLKGDWTQTPVRWHSSKSMSKDSVVYEHCYRPGTATIINTSELHSAYNITKETRYLFCLSVYLPWADIQTVIGKYQ